MKYSKNIVVMAIFVLASTLLLAQTAGAAVVEAPFDVYYSNTYWGPHAEANLGPNTNAPIGNFAGVAEFWDAAPDASFDSMLQSNAPIQATITFDQFGTSNEVLTFSHVFASGPDLISSVTTGFTSFDGDLSGDLIDFSGFESFFYLANLDNANNDIQGALQFVAQLDGLTDEQQAAMALLGGPATGKVILQSVTTAVPAPPITILLVASLLAMGLVARGRAQ